MNGTEEECNTLICSVKIFLYRAKISITQLRTDICNSLMYVCNCGTAVCNRVMEILKGTKKISEAFHAHFRLKNHWETSCELITCSICSVNFGIMFLATSQTIR